LSGTETLVVMGPASLRFKEGNKISDFEVPLNQVYKFVIPPNVTHTIKNNGRLHNIIIAFNTVKHDRNNPDFRREVLIKS
jgi:hypothetical protein